jgi:hypothetical protein
MHHLTTPFAPGTPLRQPVRLAIPICRKGPSPFK